MKNRLALFLIAAIAAIAACSAPAFLSGCTAVNNYRTARTLGQGTTEVIVAPQAHAAGFRGTPKIPFPELSLSVRHGIREKVDVGGTLSGLALGDKVQTFGLEAAAKAHMYRSPGGRFDIAVSAGASYRSVETSGALFEAVQASVPIIFGVNFGDSELAISPVVHWQRWYSMGAAPVDFPAAGMSVGYRWQFSRRYALLPEFGWAYSPTGANAFDESTLLHFGIALSRR